MNMKLYNNLKTKVQSGLTSVGSITIWSPLTKVYVLLFIIHYDWLSRFITSVCITNPNRTLSDDPGPDQLRIFLASRCRFRPCSRTKKPSSFSRSLKGCLSIGCTGLYNFGMSEHVLLCVFCVGTENFQTVLS